MPHTRTDRETRVTDQKIKMFKKRNLQKDRRGTKNIYVKDRATLGKDGDKNKMS